MHRIALENNTVISYQPPDTPSGRGQGGRSDQLLIRIITRNYLIHWQTGRTSGEYYLVSCILEDLDPRLHGSGGEPVQGTAVIVSH